MDSCCLLLAIFMSTDFLGPKIVKCGYYDEYGLSSGGGSHYEDGASYGGEDSYSLVTKCHQCSDKSDASDKYVPCTEKNQPIVECESEYCYKVVHVESGRMLKECGDLKVADVDLITEDGSAPVGKFSAAVMVPLIPQVVKKTPVCSSGASEWMDDYGHLQTCCIGYLCNSTGLAPRLPSPPLPPPLLALISVISSYLLLLQT